MSDALAGAAPQHVVASEEAAAAASGPVPLGVEVEVTGNAEVDALIERLGDADALPTESHIEVYEDVHRGLRDTLTALDARPGPLAPAHSPHQPHHPHDDRS
ncbi:hypothetical protein NGB36_31950 [Streptomyces sp. RB6PN25]|uniref:Uncharacterized protein n=1 Tax=Streptomyces humicola TaxID=2953240 RepID=A0ABT1Q550_9ACTN|nr:hypothetical protein [Streptomyces humicola]MCQ4085053.1 hypothetical protein [Streptomyces humicola]